jgi:hypothetical protein
MKIEGLLDFNTQDLIIRAWVYIKRDSSGVYSALCVADNYWKFCRYVEAPFKEDLHVEC